MSTYMNEIGRRNFVSIALRFQDWAVGLVGLTTSEAVLIWVLNLCNVNFKRDLWVPDILRTWRLCGATYKIVFALNPANVCTSIKAYLIRNIHRLIEIKPIIWPFFSNSKNIRMHALSHKRFIGKFFKNSRSNLPTLPQWKWLPQQQTTLNNTSHCQ